MGLARDVLEDLDSLAKKDLTPVAIELGKAEYEEGVRNYLIRDLPGASLLFGFPVRPRKSVPTGRFYIFDEEKTMSRPKERLVQYVYAIGSCQRECRGHGDYSDELTIRQCVRDLSRPDVYKYDFPPLFATEEEALQWIKDNPASGLGLGLQPIKLTYLPSGEEE